MNKQWMLEQIDLRIADISVQCKRLDEHCTTKSSAACMRSRLNKDKALLKLLRVLLNNSSGDVIITDPELIGAFNRLGNRFYSKKENTNENSSE